MDPRLQYLISNTNPLQSNVMDMLRPNNTINPLTSFSDTTTSTTTNPQTNNINDSFNYSSILDEMLWPK